MGESTGGKGKRRVRLLGGGAGKKGGVARDPSGSKTIATELSQESSGARAELGGEEVGIKG